MVIEQLLSALEHSASSDLVEGNAQDLEHSASSDLVEGNAQDIESERPRNMEMPSLDSGESGLIEMSDISSDDSGRELMELPYLEKETEGEVLENNPIVSESTEIGINETDNCQNEVQDIYNSTYEERLKQTPNDSGERGEWSGERGESSFTPNDEEVKDILAGYGLESITYKDAIPDFSDVSESTVEIEKMTENRSENFKQCDEKCAEQWNAESRDGKNDWTARDVKEWRQDNGYSWHERNDMKTCDLVPTKINDYFGHLGGVSECKKRDAEYSGGEFDE